MAAKAKSKLNEPVTMAKSAAEMMSNEPISIPPDLTQLAMTQIQSSHMKAAQNMAETTEIKTRNELERERKAMATPPEPFQARKEQQTANPILGMLDKLPEADRAEFIKENKDALLNSMSSTVPGAQYLARLQHGDDNGKGTGLGDIAQLVVAMAQMQSQSQQDMMSMMLNMQQLQSAGKPAVDPAAAILPLVKAISEQGQARAEQMQATVSSLQEKMLQQERERNDERMDMMRQMMQQQLETAQRLAEHRPDTLTRNDLKAMLGEIKEITGVDLKPETDIEAAREMHEHQRAMKQLDLEEARFQHQQALDSAGIQENMKKWDAMGSLIAPVYDMMKMKKQIDSGGSDNAKKIMKKARAR